MTVYRIGWKGPEIERIQIRLKELGHYLGPIDGDFGGGTLKAVKAYQRTRGLTVDGMVGPVTWGSLFDGEQMPTPAILGEPLVKKCLALTGSFETGAMPPECFAGLTGDFDKQGISFGVLQWNFGQRSLQPLILEMNAQYGELMRDIFDEQYQTLMEVLIEYNHRAQMRWARSIQPPNGKRLDEPWQGYFKTLGRTRECHGVQSRFASGLFQKARKLCGSYDLWSERGVALMFDIVVQNGSMGRTAPPLIRHDFSILGDDLDPESLEVERMRIIANRRAEAANPRWVEDVQRRKLCIANGEGQVHGSYYVLEDQYGICLRPVDV